MRYTQPTQSGNINSTDGAWNRIGNSFAVLNKVTTENSHRGWSLPKQTNRIPTGPFSGPKWLGEWETVRYVPFLSQLKVMSWFNPLLLLHPIKNFGISFLNMGGEKKEGGQRPKLLLFPVFNLPPSPLLFLPQVCTMGLKPQ